MLVGSGLILFAMSRLGQARYALYKKEDTNMITGLL